MTTPDEGARSATAKSARRPNPSGPNKVFVRKDPEAWKRRGWTSAPNSIIHEWDMPPQEIWAWIWLASHSSTFELNAKALSDANKHVGRDKAYKLIAALEDRGLLLRVYERTDAGVPYMVYELQPEPVPAEQRTAKPKQTKPRKSSFPKPQGSPDSYTSRNAGATSENTHPVEATDGAPGFLHGQESGDDQGKQTADSGADATGKGTLIPARAVPARAGESYKEDKTKKQNQPTNASDGCGAEVVGSELGWLEERSTSAASGHHASGALPDPEGVRVLRSLPHGVGAALAEHAVNAWSHVVAAALAAGTTEKVIVDKLSSGLPEQGLDRRVRIVVGRRLPDLQALSEPPQHPENGAESASEARAHAEVTNMSTQGRHGAQRAAGLLGEVWEPQRGDLDSRTWLLERLPQLAAEYVEGHRDQLVGVLATGKAS